MGVLLSQLTSGILLPNAALTVVICSIPYRLMSDHGCVLSVAPNMIVISMPHKTFGRGARGCCLWRGCKTCCGENQSRQASAKQESLSVMRGSPSAFRRREDVTDAYRHCAAAMLHYREDRREARQLFIDLDNEDNS